MENPAIRSTRVRARLCYAGVLLTVACGSYAAPVLMVESIATLTGDAGGEQLVSPANVGAPCPEAREGCSAPIDLAPDLHATPEAWTTFRVPHSSAGLWPTRTVVTPESPLELITLLVGRGVNDIRVADPQFVFSLSAPQIELASADLVRAGSRTTTIAPANVTASTLEAKADDAASRAIPDGSSVRLREMIENLTGNHTAHVQTHEKSDVLPPGYYAETGRPGPAHAQKKRETPYQDPNDWTINIVKSFTEMLVSFVKSVRDIFKD